MSKLYSFFLRSSLVLIYLVIGAGAIVRMTGSGMGCPDWPKCFGYLIPPTERSQLDWKASHFYKKGQVIIIDESLRVASGDFTSGLLYNSENWQRYSKHDYAIFNAKHTWIEFINRLLGALAGLSTILLFLTSILFFKRDKVISLISFLIITGMGFQGWLGKKVVDSNLLPYKISLHMGMALILLFLIVFLLERENKTKKIISQTGSFKLLVSISLLLTLLQIAMGTQVRQFVDVQMNYLGIQLANSWMAKAPWIFYFHRSFSLLVLGVNLILAIKLYQNGTFPLYFKFILLMIGLEILTGVWMYYFDFPFSSQPLHLLFASLLFGAQSFFMIRIFKSK